MLSIDVPSTILYLIFRAAAHTFSALNGAFFTAIYVTVEFWLKRGPSTRSSAATLCNSRPQIRSNLFLSALKNPTILRSSELIFLSLFSHDFGWFFCCETTLFRDSGITCPRAISRLILSHFSAQFCFVWPRIFQRDICACLFLSDRGSVKRVFVRENASLGPQIAARYLRYFDRFTRLANSWFYKQFSYKSLHFCGHEYEALVSFIADLP